MSSNRLPPGSTKNVAWMDIRVGDVLEIHNRENIPADMVMLSSSDPKGTCFVMTSNLDGETNLKPRVVNTDIRTAAATVTTVPEGLGQGKEHEKEGGGVLGLVAKGAYVECDLPNQKLEHFDGTMAVREGCHVAGDASIVGRQQSVKLDGRQKTAKSVLDCTNWNPHHIFVLTWPRA